ncbi:MAG: hypothetical protein ACYDAY_10355 [Candidatus Dormibacteria bacterium]
MRGTICLVAVTVGLLGISAPASASGPRPVVPQLHAMLTREAQAAQDALPGRDELPQGVGGPALPGLAADNLEFGGYHIQQAPYAYLIFWGWGAGSDPLGEGPRLTAFLSGMGGSLWLNSQTQYCENGDGTFPTELSNYCAGAGAISITNPTGMLHGTWTDTTSPAPQNNLSDADARAEATRAAAHFGDYSFNAQYVIATPLGRNWSGFAANGGKACAYHNAQLITGHGFISFTNLPYIPEGGASCGAGTVNSGRTGGLDGVTIVEGHEYAEAETDPVIGGGWVDPAGAATGSETGDKCAWTSYPLVPAAVQAQLPSPTGNFTFSTGTFPVQPLWSNNYGDGIGECVRSYTDAAHQQ